jgi:hypothetical protein
MTQPQTFAAGGYRFIPAVFQYSAGVAALPGHAIERVTFAKPLALRAGFERIRGFLHDRGRPLTAFCACELRSPEPFTEQGFRGFNEGYVVTLREWGLSDGNTNPVARTNVCPQIDPPAEPSFHAFSFTTIAQDAPPSFVSSGGGEAAEGGGSYRERIVRRGDTSAAAMREKARFVLKEMERRQALLGFTWNQTTATQVYTVHDVFEFLADEIVRRGAARNGLTWHFSRPPVVDIEYEMDCRAVRMEQVI